MIKNINIKNIIFGKNQPLRFILGPCVIESRDHVMFMAEKLKNIFKNNSESLVFKASFDKANRTSIDSFRGPGLQEGLKILQEVKEQFELPVITDVHVSDQVKVAAEVMDALQIPAFLCRQTDLLIAAGESGLPINIKKGQFLAPSDMKHTVKKIESTGNNSILLTERGSSFGYSGLIMDVRSIPIMQKNGYPVIFDATHSAQIPGGMTTGGNREFIPHMCKAAVAAGCNGIFLETHDNVDFAKSDKGTQYPLSEIEQLINQLNILSETVRNLQ